MAGRWIRWTAVAALVAGGAAAIAWAFWPQPIPADIAVIAGGTLEVTVDEEGMTRIRDIYTVSAPLGGKVLRSPREVGDTVVAGETVVAVIQPTAPAFLDVRARREAEAAVSAAEAAVSLAEAQVGEAQSQLDFAESEARRADELARRGTISERTHQQARMQVDTARARLASADATLEVRRRELESVRARLIGPESTDEPIGVDSCCVQVRAPVDGEVLSIATESEQVVAPGTPLIEIGHPLDIEVVVDLLSIDAVRLPPRAEARLDGWGGPPLTARVRRIETAGFTKVSALGIEEQRVKTVLDIVDPPQMWTGLGHGYRVVVHLVVSREEGLLVPLGALFRRGDAWAVFVVDDEGRARLRTVEIGARSTRQAVVAGGLKAGDAVVLHPNDRIADGVRVAPRSAEAR